MTEIIAAIAGAGVTALLGFFSLAFSSVLKRRQYIMKKRMKAYEHMQEYFDLLIERKVKGEKLDEAAYKKYVEAELEMNLYADKKVKDKFMELVQEFLNYNAAPLFQGDRMANASEDYKQFLKEIEDRLDQMREEITELARRGIGSNWL